MTITATQVLYCQVCSYPPEYCEFSPKASKCKTWLEDAHPELFAKYYSDTALEAKMATLSVSQKEALEKDVAKKEAKASAKEEREAAKLKSSRVVIKRIERNKRKFVTTVVGLDAFDVELKKAAKHFATAFACGASVAKVPGTGEEEIVVQGDVSDEIEEMLLASQDEDKKAFAIFGARIGEDQIDFVDEKKKKAPPTA